MDGRGPVWPWSVAPYQVHMCVLDGQQEANAARAKAIYEELTNNGFEVLWDDTNSQAGVQFADADLIGAPVRLVVSTRNEKRGVVEYLIRDGAAEGEVAASDLLSLVKSFSLT